MHFETKAIHAGMHVDEETGAIAPPLHLSTTFERSEAGETPRGFAYIRDGNPTQVRLEEALALASELHAGDRRVREPYLNHLLRVAIRIMRYYGITDVDVLVAALLHDAVEDHPAELAGLSPELGHTVLTEAAVAQLARRFGPRVAELVRSVTNPAKLGQLGPTGDLHAVTAELSRRRRSARIASTREGQQD